MKKCPCGGWGAARTGWDVGVCDGTVSAAAAAAAIAAMAASGDAMPLGCTAGVRLGSPALAVLVGGDAKGLVSAAVGATVCVVGAKAKDAAGTPGRGTPWDTTCPASTAVHARLGACTDELPCEAGAAKADARIDPGAAAAAAAERSAARAGGAAVEAAGAAVQAAGAAAEAGGAAAGPRGATAEAGGGAAKAGGSASSTGAPAWGSSPAWVLGGSGGGWPASWGVLACRSRFAGAAPAPWSMATWSSEKAASPRSLAKARGVASTAMGTGALADA